MPLCNCEDRHGSGSHSRTGSQPHAITDQNANQTANQNPNSAGNQATDPKGLRPPARPQPDSGSPALSSQHAVCDTLHVYTSPWLAKTLEWLPDPLLVVNGQCQIVMANRAVYELFDVAEPLKDLSVQSLLPEFPTQPHLAGLHQHRWVAEKRICTTATATATTTESSDSKEAVRVLFLEWSAWRIDDLSRGSVISPPESALASPRSSSNLNLPYPPLGKATPPASSLWAVTVRDVTHVEELRARLRDVAAQHEAVVTRAFEAKPLRDAMLAGQPYPHTFHRTAVIAFLDIKGSTGFKKETEHDLFAHTQRIVDWCADLDNLPDDSDILKLELVGDAYVISAGLFDQVMMHHQLHDTKSDTPNNHDANPDAKPEGKPEANPEATAEGSPPGFARTPTASAFAPTATTSILSAEFVTPTETALASARTATAPTSADNTARTAMDNSIAMAVEATAGLCEERVQFMLAKCCRFLLRAAATSLRYGFQLRAGVHIGPVVSCSVGTKMPKLMVVGQPMDFASRLQHSGKPGAVHILSKFAERFLSTDSSLSISKPTNVDLHSFGSVRTSLVTTASL